MDEDRIRQLASQYSEMKARQETLLEELKELQQRMAEVMLRIIDETRA